LRRGAEFLQSIGLVAIEGRVRDLTSTCIRVLKSKGLRTTTPENWDERAHIVNVLVPDADALMASLREKHRVVTNAKDGALRLSMSFFNSEEDIERAVHAIASELSHQPTAAVR
jgi:selenocysteine lyase/cysteine desulfurase